MTQIIYPWLILINILSCLIDEYNVMKHFIVGKRPAWRTVFVYVSVYTRAVCNIRSNFKSSLMLNLKDFWSPFHCKPNDIDKQLDHWLKDFWGGVILSGFLWSCVTFKRTNYCTQFKFTSHYSKPSIGPENVVSKKRNSLKRNNQNLNFKEENTSRFYSWGLQRIVVKKKFVQ